MKFILFFGIDVTDANPVTTGVCGVALTALLVCLARGWGLL